MARLVKIDLQKYKAKIIEQQQNLEHSLVFNFQERQQVSQVYDDLLEIVCNKIAMNCNVIH